MTPLARGGARGPSVGTLHRAALVALFCSTLSADPVDAQQLPEVAAGRAVTIALPVPSTDGVRPAVLRIEPADGMAIEGASLVLLAGVNQVTVTVNVPATAPPGLFSAARVTFLYVDGRRTAIECYVRVLAPGAPSEEKPSFAASSDHMFGGIEPLSRIPGTLAPVWIPSGTLGTVPVTEAVDYPSITRRNSVNSRMIGQRANTLSGVAYAGATELGLRGRSEPDAGFGIDLSGRVAGSTQVNAVYLHGWNPGLSPVFRYGMHRSRGHLRIRAPAWSFEAGEIRPASLLAGVVAPADGASLEKTQGLLRASVTAGRPKYFGGGWGGHLYQGSIGLGFKNASVSLFASDIARPVQSVRVVATPAPEEDSEQIVEDLERVGELLSRENRMRSSGIETRLKFGRHHITARGGWLDLVSATGNERAGGPVATGSYSFKSDRGSFNGQFRTGPPSLPGTALGGDLLTLGGKLTVVGPFALVGRTFWRESSLLGRSRPTRGMGAATGFEYVSNQSRFHVQGNYRESTYLTTTVTRSITAGLRQSMGVFGIDTALEYGEADDGRRRRRIATYRGAVYAEGQNASLMLSGSYRDYGISRPRLSLDLSGTIDWRGATFEAGTGVSRAGIFGDVFNAYTAFEFPVPGELSILLGADYDRWSYADSRYLIFLMDDEATPPWRFTVSVRKKLTVPMPLVK